MKLDEEVEQDSEMTANLKKLIAQGVLSVEGQLQQIQADLMKSNERDDKSASD